jgi:PAS domain S-box-containing protein
MRASWGEARRPLEAQQPQPGTVDEGAVSIPIRILLLEDNTADADPIRDILGEHFICEITQVRTQIEFGRALEGSDFDLILADCDYPSGTAIAALELARRARPDLPFISISNTMGEDLAVETIKLGAADCVSKNRLARLVPSVDRALREAQARAERQRAEQELRTSEARFRTFVDHAMDAFFLYDEQSSIVDVNRRSCEYLGYSREELIGMHPRDFDAGFDEVSLARLGELVAGGHTATSESLYRRKDGTVFPVEIRSRPFQHGAHRFRLSLVRDVTERKRAEDALRRRESYLAEAQRLSQTGTIVFNATQAVYWSDESYRIWGLDPLQGLPHLDTVLERIHPDDRNAAHEAAFDALYKKQKYEIEFRIVLPDGTVKYLESVGHPLLSATGNVEMIATHIDVTERKRAQAEHERLRQLEADLAHVNRLSIMGELAASLAHDILHPIATARNNARAGMRFLEMSPPDLDEVREALGCVVRDADRAKDIVGRMRDHIKKAPPRHDLFDLNEAINEVIVMVRSAIDKNSVSVHTRLEEGLIPVRGDRVQLQQVIVNLVLNAIEAMSSIQGGARELSITTEQSETEGILVAVRDSGPGIDPGQFDRILEPFYTTKISGLGMGLSICRSIINGHGGRLWAGPNEPRGAVFQFTLPAAQDDS